MNAERDDYERRRNQHRPSDPALMLTAIAQLRALGLTDRDIAAALGVAVEAVRTPQ